MTVGVVGVGQPAPDFTLRTADGAAFTREDLLGRTTVLVFYPFAFSEVCTSQLSIYNYLLEDFAAKGAVLYGVSCDATHSQTAFKRSLSIEIEQLSDFEPKGAACRAFGVYHPGGFPQRALVIDFSRPVFMHGFGMVVKKGFSPKSWADVNKPEVRIAVDLGSVHETSARRFASKSTITAYKNVGDDPARRDELDAALLDFARGADESAPDEPSRWSFEYLVVVAKRA